MKLENGAVICFFVCVAHTYGLSMMAKRDLDSHQAFHPGSDKRLTSTYKTGPTPGAWYYIMGHPGSKKRAMATSGASDLLQHIQPRDLTGVQLLKELVAFMEMKSMGVLDYCLDTIESRRQK